MIFTNRESPPCIGMDDGWYPRFLDAYFESKAPCELDIWRVRKNQPGQEPEWLTGEMSWDEVWHHVRALRQSDPNCRYDCEHAICTSAHRHPSGISTFSRPISFGSLTNELCVFRSDSPKWKRTEPTPRSGESRCDRIWTEFRVVIGRTRHRMVAAEIQEAARAARRCWKSGSTIFRALRTFAGWFRRNRVR